MNQIWKYEIPKIGIPVTISMPKDSIFRCVQMQHDVPCIWMQIDRDMVANENRVFILIGTGHSFDASGRFYYGTVQNVGFVWHLYEVLLDATNA